MPKELSISEDEGSIPFNLDEDDEDDRLATPEDSGESVDASGEDEDDAKLSLVESSDAEDLIPLNEAEEIAFEGGLMDWPDEGDSNGEDKDEEWTGFGNGSPALGEKRKRKGVEGLERRKKARSLPTFASYDDYAKLIEEGPEDDI